MRSPATLFALVLLVASRPLPVGGQESPQSSAPTGPADSARAAKGNREAAKRAAKEAERVRKDAEDGPPTTVTVAPLPRGQRPTLSVLAFRYLTVTNQANYGVRLPRGVTHGTVITDPEFLAHEDNQNLGAASPSW